jgi:hypothetical protein
MSAEAWVSVVRGAPTDEELAALVAVLGGLAASGAVSPGPSPTVATTATLRRTGRALVGRENRWGTTTPQWSHPRRAVPAPVRAPAPAA